MQAKLNGSEWLLLVLRAFILPNVVCRSLPTRLLAVPPGEVLCMAHSDLNAKECFFFSHRMDFARQPAFFQGLQIYFEEAGITSRSPKPESTALSTGKGCSEAEPQDCSQPFCSAFPADFFLANWCQPTRPTQQAPSLVNPQPAATTLTASFPFVSSFFTFILHSFYFNCATPLQYMPPPPRGLP